MVTSWVALSIKSIKIVYFNGVNVAKHWYVAGRVLTSLIALLSQYLNLNTLNLRGSIIHPVRHCTLS